MLLMRPMASKVQKNTNGKEREVSQLTAQTYGYFSQYPFYLGLRAEVSLFHRAFFFFFL